MGDRVDSITVTLDVPVTFKDRTYSELTFGRRKAKHLLKMDAVKGEIAKSFALYAAMADVPFQVIEELDGDDYERIAEETLPLMGKSVAKEAKRLMRG